jgi:long-chain acyl-CoA synthetase
MNQQAFFEYKDRMRQVFGRKKGEIAISCLMKKGNVKSISFEKIHQYAKECAELKNRYGLKNGDRVLLMADNNCDMLIGYLILSYNHLTVVLADSGTPETELKGLIRTCEISAAFIEKKSLRLLEEQSGIPVFDTWTIEKGLSVLIDQPNTQKAAPTPATAAIIFSSGTTSRMKPVEVPYDAIIYAQEQNGKAFGVTPKSLQHPTFLTFPLTHISGLGIAMCLFLYGGKLGTTEQLNATTMKAGMEIFEPSLFGMVPKVFDMFIDKLYEELGKKKLMPVFQILRQISAFFRKKLGIRWVGRICMTPFRKALFGKNMVYVGGGGAPWKPETVEVLQDLGLHFLNVYASTECGLYITASLQERDYPSDSVGKAKSNRFGKVVIKNPDANGIGEICTKTGFIMNGYYGDAELTKNAFDEEGYFKTGDNGYIDEKGYLHITGRQKESILLQSGKKIAPSDLAELFGPLLTGLNFAFIGVPAEGEGFDKIHLFIEKNSLSEAEQMDLQEKILSFQRKSAVRYPIKKIHYIREIPVTKIGKTKGYILKEIALEEEKNAGAMKPDSRKEQATTQEQPANSKQPDQDWSNTSEEEILKDIIQIIQKYGKIDVEMTGMEDLTADLGIDSLSMMEICTAIEEKYHVAIGKFMMVLPNAVEIADYIRDPFLEKIQKGTQTKEEFNAYDFPKKRRLIHKAVFSLMMWLSRRIYRFEVHGLENIQQGKQYIFCPNHVTHFDGLWTWTALGKKAPKMDQIGCMAKKEHLDSGVTRFFLTMLGGIPVDRAGDSSQSVMRSLEFIREGNDFLIHPEGTRTRNGNLGPFKNGAASLSIKTGVPIVPIVFQGGYEVFPSSAKMLKLWDENHHKYTFTFTFCEPIEPEGKSMDEITALLRKSVEEVL